MENKRQEIYTELAQTMGFPDGLVVKNPPAKAGDVGSISGSGRSSGEGNGNPLQYSFLENSMNRGAWQAAVHGVAKVGYDLATKQETCACMLSCFSRVPLFVTQWT